MERADFQRVMYGLHSVKIAQDWNRTPGLEYWLQPGLVSQGVGTFSGGLMAVTSNGWVNTGTVIGVAGSGADFPAAAEFKWYSSVAANQASDRGTPNHFAIDTAADLLNSPAIFGDPTHMEQAAWLAERDELPSKLVFDSMSAFDAANNETASGLGFVEDGGAASVANDHLACFFIDGTSFRLRNDTATSAALMAADTLFHHFRVVIDRINQLAYAYIDNMATALGSIAIKADEFPCSFGAGVLTATGANFIKLGPTRIRYAWGDMK